MVDSKKARRIGGARAGGFPGADKILGELEHGTARRRVGLRAGGPRAGARRRAVIRGCFFFRTESAGSTSGGFGPSLNAPVAMGYLPASKAEV